MTVRELLKHFGFYFSRIVFFDKTNNIQDTAYIGQMQLKFAIYSHSKTAKCETEFLNEYGDYKVITWEVDTTITSITDGVYLSIEIEKG